MGVGEVANGGGRNGQAGLVLREPEPVNLEAPFKPGDHHKRFGNYVIQHTLPIEVAVR